MKLRDMPYFSVEYNEGNFADSSELLCGLVKEPHSFVFYTYAIGDVVYFECYQRHYMIYEQYM